MDNIVRTDLSNGVRVISQDQPHALTATVGAWLGVGSVDESASQAGLAHFLEHLIFKGTPSRNARQIAERFDALGADINAFTTKETTCVHARVLPEDLTEAVETIADLIENPTLGDIDIEAERGVVLEEIAMHEDTPDDLVYDLLAEAVWAEQGIGRRIQGVARTIKAATPDAIRAFHAATYPRVPLVLAASGRVDHAALVSTAERCFRSERPSALRADIWPRTTPARAVLGRDVEQSHLVLGVPGLSRTDERRWALAVLNSALGGGMSSRLFQQIREERGLAYQVGSGNQGFAGCGLFTIYAGCHPKHVAEVAGLIRGIVAEVARQGITDDELERAKGHLIGGLLMGFEEPGAMMHHLGKSLLLTPTLLMPDQIRDRIEAVTSAACLEVARELFWSTDWSVAVVGPTPDPQVEGFRLDGEAA
ncbi:MAG: M16 family metallopeptidase [Actinomycetota bacterium]